MKKGKSRLSVILLVLTAITSGCNLPSFGAQPEAAPTEVPGNVEPPPTEIPIQHTVIPINLPDERSSHAGDYDSSLTAEQKMAGGGDRFTYGHFERPFNADTMDIYYSQMDIIDTLVYQDDTWIYGAITLKDMNPTNAADVKYALELDLDLDGKADWLVVASKPASTEWSVDDVQAFEDTNDNVGDKSAMYTDKNASVDGFETPAFDQGAGLDPDAAWARISPANPNTVEITVKRSLLGEPEEYLINMWAGTSDLDPALFDLNDKFTHEQAGAADPGYEYFYPIKEVAEIDNSCRMAVGFEPTGQEPGLCEVFIPKGPGQPGQPPPPGCTLNTSICAQQGAFFDSVHCECDTID